MDSKRRIRTGRGVGTVALAGVGCGLLLVHAGAGRQAKKQSPGIMEMPPFAGAKMLFAGTKEQMEANFVQNGKPASWLLTGDVMQSRGGTITTRESYGDYQLHVEFKVPNKPEAHGQEKGNSGLGLQSRYEIQILDSTGFASPGKGDCGAVYNTAAPLLAVEGPPETWQAYDIVFRRPRFGADGKKTENARVTVLHNGIAVQNNTEIPKPTGIGAGNETPDPAPIQFQDHGNPVQFRNIWIVPLPDKGSDTYEPH